MARAGRPEAEVAHHGEDVGVQRAAHRRLRRGALEAQVLRAQANRAEQRQQVDALRPLDGLVRLRAADEAGVPLADMVYTKTFVTDMAKSSEQREAKLEALGDDIRPTGTLLGIPALIGPETAIEIEAEAIIGAASARKLAWCALPGLLRLGSLGTPGSASNPASKTTVICHVSVTIIVTTESHCQSRSPAVTSV